MELLIGTRDPYALFLIRIEGPVWIDRHASGLAPKNLLEAQAEAMDLMVPLFADLVTMVQLERCDLTYKVLELLGTVLRHLWFVCALRARQVRRDKRRRAAEDRDRNRRLTSTLSGSSERGFILRTFLPPSAAPRAVVSAPMRTCRERATFCIMLAVFAV